MTSHNPLLTAAPAPQGRSRRSRATVRRLLLAVGGAAGAVVFLARLPLPFTIAALVLALATVAGLHASADSGTLRTSYVAMAPRAIAFAAAHGVILGALLSLSTDLHAIAAKAAVLTTFCYWALQPRVMDAVDDRLTPGTNAATCLLLGTYTGLFAAGWTGWIRHEVPLLATLTVFLGVLTVLTCQPARLLESHEVPAGGH